MRPREGYLAGVVRAVPRSCAVITNGNQDADREASEMRGGFGFPRRSSSRPTCPKKSNSRTAWPARRSGRSSSSQRRQRRSACELAAMTASSTGTTSTKTVHLRRAAPAHRNRRKSSRHIQRSYTISVASRALRSQTVEYKQDRGAMPEHDSVCDNQCATARKLLILKTERCPSG
jgi:hypothetical protein